MVQNPVVAGKLDLSYASRFGESGIRKVTYDTATYDFAGKISAYLVAQGFLEEPVPLEDVHRHVDPDALVVDDGFLNALSRACYDLDQDPEWIGMYHAFLKDVALSTLGFDAIFQRTPTVRLHCPAPLPDWAKTEHGRTIGWHSDTMLGHPFEEVNVWLPVTDTFGSNALVLSDLADGTRLLERYLESIDHDAETYFAGAREGHMALIREDPDYEREHVECCRPYAMSYGEVIFFDPRCMHGADESREAKTRVSLDFRLIPVDCEPHMVSTREYRGRGRRKSLFARGGAYHDQSIGDLSLD